MSILAVVQEVQADQGRSGDETMMKWKRNGRRLMLLTRMQVKQRMRITNHTQDNLGETGQTDGKKPSGNGRWTRKCTRRV